MYLNNKKRALIAGQVMILVYVLMLCIQVFTQRHTEYFPFYSWSLFSSAIGDQPLRKSYLKVEEIDGRTLDDDEGVYTVGTSGARLEKAIVELKRDCSVNESVCEKRASALLGPVLGPIDFQHSLRYSAKFCFIDAHTYMEQLKQGMNVIPKRIECQREEIFGPFVVRTDQ